MAALALSWRRPLGGLASQTLAQFRAAHPRPSLVSLAVRGSLVARRTSAHSATPTRLAAAQPRPSYQGDPGMPLMASEPQRGGTQRALRNPVGVQMLAPALHSQVFPPTSRPSAPLHEHALSLARSHLAAHGLDPSQASTLPEVNFPLPPLQGADLSEHFWNLGDEVGQPWLTMAHEFAASQLPPMPEGLVDPKDAASVAHEEEGSLPASDWLDLPADVRSEIHLRTPRWLMQPGWVRYPLLHSKDGQATALGPGEPVDHPLASDGSLVFDVETMTEESQFAVMATAAGSKAWYAWLSPWLLGKGEGCDRKDHLIRFGDDHPHAAARLLVGHNVGYDRARIRDEYRLERGQIRFLDTMALHVATRGISSPQRPAWMKHAKARAERRAERALEKEHMEEAQREAIRALLAGEDVPADALRGVDVASLLGGADEDAGGGTSVAAASIGASAAEAEDSAATLWWQDVTSKNSLADVAALHCGIEVSKDLRDIFIDGTPREGILERLEELLGYCATDVAVTHAVFTKVWPSFVENCPHPATAAGVLGLGNAILPVDDEWDEYIARCTAQYEAANEQVQRSLIQLAEKLKDDGSRGLTWDEAARYAAMGPLARDDGGPWWTSDAWASQLDWTPKRPKVSKAALEDATADHEALGLVPRWYKTHFMGSAKGITARSGLAPIILQLEHKGRRIVRDDEGSWVLQDGDGNNVEALPSGPLSKAVLQSDVGQEMTSAAGPDGQAALDAIRSGESGDVVRDLLGVVATQLKDAGARHVALDWALVQPPAPAKSASQPTPENTAWWPKWYWDLYKAATGEVELTIRTKIAPLLLRVSWQGCPLHHSREHGWTFRHDARSNAEFRTRQTPLRFEHPADAGAAALLGAEPALTFYKVPHTAGDDSSVGSPFSKNFLPFFTNGTLRSEHPDAVGQEAARSALDLSAQCSYWIGVRDRVEKQMVVWDGQGGSSMGFAPGVSGARQDEPAELVRRKGLILPQVITMGTVTRRAIERTWLTASNAKKNRVGSELKSMVKAPPGWTIVGADVDSEELWICSVMGDAQFGFHGATAVGWMTLEGTKALGTDLHSKTASILGTSRNDAKVFNYSRIYGAGIRHATQLLLKADPSMTAEDAMALAKKLYTSTKGANTGTGRHFGRRFWYGGSESYVFNKLEEVATSEHPRTPALGCGITAALSKRYLPKPEPFSGNGGSGGNGGHAGRANNAVSESDYMPSRINWVVQSSGVDYLHLVVVAMEWLCERYAIEARFMLSVHDEVRYLAKEDDAARTALALQIANLWTRAMFAHKLQMEDLPQGVAFFAQVDIDKVLRKEADDPCVTPSQPRPIPKGEAVDIVEILKRTGGGSLGPARASGGKALELRTPYKADDQQHRALGERGFLFLQAQAAESIHEIRRLDQLAKEADRSAAFDRDAWLDEQASSPEHGDAKPKRRGGARSSSTSRAGGVARQTKRATAKASSASPSGRAAYSTAASPPSSDEALSQVASAFPPRPFHARVPFFRTASHRSYVQWQLYRPLLRACPAREFPEISSMIRGLTRAKKRVTSPEQTKVLFERGWKLLGQLRGMAAGVAEDQAAIEALEKELRDKKNRELSERAWDWYERDLNPPPEPRPSGALLPPSIYNAPTHRFKPVQPLWLTMSYRQRRRAREARMHRRFNAEEISRAARAEAALVRQLPVGAREALEGSLDWENQVEDIRRIQREAARRGVERAQMVMPRRILVEAKKARKAKHRWHQGRKYKAAVEKENREAAGEAEPEMKLRKKARKARK